jgi:predicted DNA-binding protein (MmcQ/YjbR family)
LNKRHWISIATGPGIARHLVEDLIENSYELVAPR